MEEFLRAVVESLDAASIPARMEGGSLYVCGCRYSVYRGRGSVIIGGDTYRRELVGRRRTGEWPVAAAVRNVLYDLPKKLTELEKYAGVVERRKLIESMILPPSLRVEATERGFRVSFTVKEAWELCMAIDLLQERL